MDNLLSPFIKTRKKRQKRRRQKKRTIKLGSPKMVKSMNCSPAVKGKTLSVKTCYTEDVLNKIKQAYNADHNSDIIVATDANEIWNQLNQRLVQCKKEDCWLKQIKDDTLRKQIDEYIFAPDQPPEWKKNPNEWLSNFDIMEVLKQYEKTYPNFKLIGPTPIDFDKRSGSGDDKCVWTELCTFDLKRYIDDGKTKLGIVINTDDSEGPGEHWITLYVDIENHFIFFLDSAGNTIPKEVKALKDRIIKQGKKMVPPIVFDYHTNGHLEHQMGNTECGMYSLFFIITMLTQEVEKGQRMEEKEQRMEESGGQGTGYDKKNMSLDELIALFKKQKIPDKYVQQYRHIYFNE